MRSILSAIILSPAILSAALIAAPAAAQDLPPAAPADLPEAGADFVIAGAGAALVPDYEGSDDYAFTPFPAAIGQIDRFRFVVVGNRASVDLIREAPSATIDVQAGPIGVVNFNRANADAIDDARVALLDERGTAIELGGYVGIGKVGVVTSAYDRLSATLSYRTDVSGVHEAGIWSPSINYSTPLSTRSIAGLFVSAEHVGDGYADAYFDVTAPEAARSGLAAFDADGGWKHYTIGVAFAHSLTGNLFGGLQLVAGGSYKRMLNDFGDSPVTADAGSRNQWIGAVGLAYSF